MAEDVRSLVVIGADSMDFAYGVRNASAKLSALNLAANSGAPATLFNFSLRQDISREGRRLLKFLHPDVRVIARDTLSQARAKELLDRDDVSTVPDVGILLEPQETSESEQIQAWANTKRTAALTVNNHLGVTFSSRNMLDYFVDLGKVLLGAGYEVLVIAHDTRPSPNDPALAKAVSERLGKATRVGLPSTAREAKAMISHVDVHLASRMHAAVASLSQGIPTIGLDYVDKFRGQFSWYQAEEFVIPWHASDAEERVNQLLNSISSDRNLIERINCAADIGKRKFEDLIL
ncbi:polysaccharide pyruvyl transferase family protein [Cellulosimicrobium funkei]|nr:polysaccharide pyruvyl transferase family protein [Cellulosimicrobium funkei]